MLLSELQDTETFNDMDRLPVFLFDNDTDGIMVGESVIIKGEIEVIKKQNKILHLSLWRSHSISQ
jgi:hypothetical protein